MLKHSWGGAIFFSKNPSSHETINDLNGNVITFYSVLKNKFKELKEKLELTLHHEHNYFKSREIYNSPDGYSDVEIAWAIWCQCHMTFSNKINSGFAFSNTGKEYNKTRNAINKLSEKYTKRLEQVCIFSRDALDLIKLKDTENTFFYLDPPYVSSNCGHYKGYTMSDFKNLLDLLVNIKGKFLLSSYPESLLFEYRKEHNWQSKDIKQIITAMGGKGVAKNKKYKTECLTANYDLYNDYLFSF